MFTIDRPQAQNFLAILNNYSNAKSPCALRPQTISSGTAPTSVSKVQNSHLPPSTAITTHL